MILRRSCATFMSLILLAGCSFIPAYQRPALPVSPQYPTPPMAAAPTVALAAADFGWRDFFADPVLDQLIAFGLSNNRNLRVAVLNVSQAQAQYHFDRASLFPILDASGTYLKYHAPGSASGFGVPLDYQEFSVAGAVSWELDLFGKIRSQAEATRQTYLGNADTVLSAQISLIAQLASEYFTWLADRDALQINLQTAAAQEKSLELTQLSANNGIDTAMDVAQAETTVDTARANVAQYTRQVAQDMDEIVLLAGAPLPASLLQRMDAVAGLDASPALPDVPAGLPSDLLERRPDIRAAEHTLLAANANIGAARAAFFPSISITTQGGTATSRLSHLFGGGQALWQFEPQVTLPIFTGGENVANLDIAKLGKRIEIANYEQAIQSAFHDVSDALNARGTYLAQVQAQTNLVDADSRYYQLADLRLTSGTDTYLNLLTAENMLLAARLQLVSLKLAARVNSITLYKALGGGWQERSGPSPALP